MATKKETVENEDKTLNLESIQAEVAAILAQAKAEAAKIVAEAKAATGKKVNSPMNEEELAAYNAYMNEYVEVKLFKDNGKYKDDVFVSINDENCLIQRGVRVKVKRKFADALERSEEQIYKNSVREEKLADDFAKTGL